MSPAREESLALCTSSLVGGTMEVTPQQLEQMVRASAGAGFRGISLWAFHYQSALAGGMSDEQLQRLLGDAGISVRVIEVVMGWETGDTALIDAQCTDTLDLARRYGAQTVVGIAISEVESWDAAVAGWAHLARRAAERDLRLAIEFVPGTGITTIAQAWKLTRDTGLGNVGIVLDSWHWHRQPGGPDLDTLRTIPGERIECVQLDDCPAEPADDPLIETMTARLLPGQGDVDHATLLSALDEIGADPLWAPEVFSTELMALGPDEFARRIAAASRDLLGLQAH